MYAPERLRDIWHLELFLFGGIPEEEEAMFERFEDMNGAYDPRRTRQASSTDSIDHNDLAKQTDLADQEVLFYWRDDEENDDIVYRPAE